MNNITVKVLADSISPQDERMISLEIEYPRFILAELNTHRMLSKNSASSRAIPEAAMHNELKNNPAMPVYWGKNKSGMTAEEELSDIAITSAKELWLSARDSAMAFAKVLFSTGLHKQVSNRVTEPWMMMKTVISGTEWANLRYLRDHPDAQPEFQDLAHKIGVAIDTSKPKELIFGEWHLPYVNCYRSPIDGFLHYFDSEGTPLSVKDAIKLSASCCAQVSYRKSDATMDKANKVYDMLNLDSDDKPKHASPVEHQATPMRITRMARFEPSTWQEGVTHVSANGDLWSGNLRGWIQYRKLIQGEAKW